MSGPAVAAVLSGGGAKAAAHLGAARAMAMSAWTLPAPRSGRVTSM